MVAAAELTYNTGASAEQMAAELFGDGVLILGASYTGDAASSAIYSNGDALAPNTTPGDTGVILSTGQATSFTNSTGDANQNTNTTTNTAGEDANADFDEIAGAGTFDASYLDVRFVPEGDTYSIQFTYSSEEYPEFVNSIFNDIIGVWVNDTFVELAVGNGNSSIGNINAGNNAGLFSDNGTSDANTEMDGFTATLTLTLNVNPGEENTIRIGIADVGDANFDSSVLIAGGSIQNEVLLGDDAIDIVQNGSRDLDVLSNDTDNSGGTLTITHVNGQEVSVGDTITLSTGQEITLNADGTFTVNTDADIEAVNFSYTAENDNGVSDTAFVTVNTIPCFVAGTLILTELGERPVELLEPGCRVQTVDNGLQPIRWVGQRTIAASGTMAPIQIASNTFGEHRALRVSPQHRILLRDKRAELLFAQREVLVTAKDLINDITVTRKANGRPVTYVHLLFDDHQVIYSEGLPTESFLPGPNTLAGLEQDIVDEIYTLFPEIDPQTGWGYGQSARTALKAHEAQLLLG